MIGKSIRGLRHLWRACDDTLQTAIVSFHNGQLGICKVCKFQLPGKTRTALFIFNNQVNAYDSKQHNLSAIKHKAIEKYGPAIEPYAGIVVYEFNGRLSSYDAIKGITLLPTDYEAQFDKFMAANTKFYKAIHEKFGYPQNDIIFNLSFCYSNGSRNFFTWAVNALVRKASLSMIKHALIWNDEYSQLAKKLKKGTITAYTSVCSIITMLEEMSALRKEKRINDTINSFNTAQKKMLRQHTLSPKDRDALNRFANLSFTKRSNFIKKASSITDFDEFIQLLKHVTEVHFDWNKESFLNYINNVEGLKFKIVHDEGQIMVLEIFNYETIKRLGKTTNWCISKNLSYWVSYIESSDLQPRQFMIFDFNQKEDDKLSIIGLTTKRNKAITAAHNFVNESLLTDNEARPQRYHSLLERFNRFDIYKILKADNIPLSLIVQYDQQPYQWNREAVLSFLYKCVNKENTRILMQDDAKMAISVNDENIKYFLGAPYVQTVPSSEYYLEHIIFFDFSKDKDDPSKLRFAIIFVANSIEYPSAMYNERCEGQPTQCFETALIEYGLPYNTIKRPNDYKKLIRDLWMNHDFEIGDKVIEERGFNFASCLKFLCGEEWFQILYYSMEYVSLDAFKWFEKHRINYSEVLDDSMYIDLLKQPITRIMHMDLNGISAKVKSEQRETYLFDGTLDTADETRDIYNLVVFKLMVQARKDFSNDATIINFIRRGVNLGRKNLLLDEMVWAMLRTWQPNTLGDDATSYLAYAKLSGNAEMAAYLAGKGVDGMTEYSYIQARS